MLTSSQQLCLEELGNVLVVAGAGTGKTSTLVERCVHLLLNQNCSLEEILMVTFTDAAAAQMRERIRSRLMELLKSVPDTSPQAGHLQRQLSLLDTAPICTLHSFCLRLVRQHFHHLGISPAVLVLDEKQTVPLIAQTFDALFAASYGSDSPEARAVQHLISSLGRGSEETLRRLTLKLYQYAQSLDDPEGWLARQLALYEQPQPAAWREWLVTGFGPWRQHWLPELQRENVIPVIRDILEALPRVEGSSVNEIIAALTAIQQIDQNKDNWPRGSKTTIRARLKSFFADVEFLHSALVPTPGQADPLEQDWDWVRDDICAYLRLSRDFSAYYTKAKRDLGGLDFSDLEQFALRLLREPAIARQWQDRLRFIFVDEFQDINRAQDAILRLLSRESRQPNRFLVGDVKQSIYRFRRANPKIFCEYEERWRESSGKRVPLSENFRSREALLDFVNALFATLMRPAAGGIAYAGDVHLQFGNARDRQPLSRTAPAVSPNNPASPRVELHLINEASEEGEAADTAEDQPAQGSALLDLLSVEREARLAALCVRDLKQQQHAIWDAAQNRFRPVEWRDMVVLLRSPANRVEAFAKEFHRLGVPLAAARSGFFQSLEISDLLNVLKLLDNPLQDLPLLGVLRSPLVALSLDELVEIRAHNREKPFWCALTKFHRDRGAQHSSKGDTAWEKVDIFFRQFNHWRVLARQSALSVCLERILADTHYEAVLLAEPRGEERVANVRRLLELIREYDPWQRQGLYRFLRFLEAQEEAEVDQEPAPIQTEDAVRLMSIHKSKGLEFPVVVLAGLGGRFNTQDLRDDLLLHETYGLCPKVKPPDSVQSYPSLAYWLAKQDEHRELLGEELRLLYVAMTRARDTLLLLGAAKSPSWREDEAAPLSDRQLLSARCYWDWLKKWLPQVTTGKDWTNTLQGQTNLLRWSLYAADDPRLEVSEDSGPEIMPATGEPLDQLAMLKLQEKILFKYPHATATHEPAIKRISEIIWSGADSNEEAQLRFAPVGAGNQPKPTPQLSFGFAGQTPIHPSRKTRRKTVDFSFQKPVKRTLTAAQIGDATHRFLENVPLEHVTRLSDLTQAAQDMLKTGLLTESELKALDFEALLAFWSSEIGRRILANPAPRIQRELPFTMRLLPEDLQRLQICPSAEELQGERFVGRGQVDLAVIQPKEIWVLDFKTDRLTLEELPEKVIPYSRQLKLYALALSQIHRRPVTERWLHFLSLRKTVSIGELE